MGPDLYMQYKSPLAENICRLSLVAATFPDNNSWIYCNQLNLYNSTFSHLHYSDWDMFLPQKIERSLFVMFSKLFSALTAFEFQTNWLPQ